jgi:hypothetical protein
MKGINMYLVRFTGPNEAMVYATSKTQAESKFHDLFITSRLATGLQIADHVRAEKPIIGEPMPPPCQPTEPAIGVA